MQDPFMQRWCKPGQITMTQRQSAAFTKQVKTIYFSGPPCRQLEDMTAAEIAELERQYGCRVLGRFEWGLA